MNIRKINEDIEKALLEIDIEHKKSLKEEFKTDKIINKVVKEYSNGENISDFEDWLNDQIDHAIISSNDVLDCYKDIVDVDDKAYREIFITVLDYLKAEIREKLNIED